MLSGKKILGLVPARGGSKRLPRKNVLPFNGDPLIAWTIWAALGSMYLDKVVVSSEDNQIQRIAVDYCADLVIDRPQELASDSASSVDSEHSLAKGPSRVEHGGQHESSHPLRRGPLRRQLELAGQH